MLARTARLLYQNPSSRYPFACNRYILFSSRLYFSQKNDKHKNPHLHDTGIGERAGQHKQKSKSLAADTLSNHSKDNKAKLSEKDKELSLEQNNETKQKDQIQIKKKKSFWQRIRWSNLSQNSKLYIKVALLSTVVSTIVTVTVIVLISLHAMDYINKRYEKTFKTIDIVKSLFFFF